MADRAGGGRCDGVKGGERGTPLDLSDEQTTRAVHSSSIHPSAPPLRRACLCVTQRERERDVRDTTAADDDWCPLAQRPVVNVVLVRLLLDTALWANCKVLFR